MNSMNRQAGLSLIELMISIVLGFILMAAAISSMLSTKQTYEVNDDLSRAQENGRLALDLMVRDLRMAGYRDPVNGDAPELFLTTACGGINPCTENGEGAGTASDRFAVQFDPPENGPELDCTGAAVAPKDLIANIYSITNTDGINSLSCRTFNVTSNTLGNPQPLIDGVDSMHVLYGIGPADSATSFVSADDVADWNEVKAIRLAVLVSDGSGRGSARERARSYIVLDADKQTYTDKHARSIYSTTVYFNNSALN